MLEATFLFSDMQEFSMKVLLTLFLMGIILVAGCIDSKAKPYYYCDSKNDTICSDFIERCTESKIKIGIPFNIFQGSFVQTVDITNMVDSCHIVYNVTDVKVTEEVLLKDYVMVCDFPLSEGKLTLDNDNPAKDIEEYCQTFEVLLTPENATE